jgi:hypothetical protein
MAGAKLLRGQLVVSVNTYAHGYTREQTIMGESAEVIQQPMAVISI